MGPRQTTRRADAVALWEVVSPLQPVAIVGDNLASNIVGGRHAGPTTIVVLTGTSVRDDVATAHVTPDLVLPDLAALL
jgi:ribonucleotide monophosphatase NagD (HAD superfamily)